MPAIALYSDNKSLLCFLLIAGDESIELGATQRDCVFSGAPAEPVDLKHPLSVVRNNLQELEHQLVKTMGLDGEMTLSIQLTEEARLTLSIENEIGTWVLSDPQGESSGLCVAPNNM